MNPLATRPYLSMLAAGVLAAAGGLALNIATDEGVARDPQVAVRTAPGVETLESAAFDRAGMPVVIDTLMDHDLRRAGTWKTGTLDSTPGMWDGRQVVAYQVPVTGPDGAIVTVIGQGLVNSTTGQVEVWASMAPGRDSGTVLVGVDADSGYVVDILDGDTIVGEYTVSAEEAREGRVVEAAMTGPSATVMVRRDGVEEGRPLEVQVIS